MYADQVVPRDCDIRNMTQDNPEDRLVNVTIMAMSKTTYPLEGKEMIVTQDKFVKSSTGNSYEGELADDDHAHVSEVVENTADEERPAMPDGAKEILIDTHYPPQAHQVLTYLGQPDFQIPYTLSAGTKGP